MAKRKERIIEKGDYSDDIDVNFAASDDNLDLIIDELAFVTDFLARDEQNQRVKDAKAKNRDQINKAQREWYRQNPDKVREYAERRDKEAVRKQARERYQVNRDKERERQRIIREKRRAAKLAQQGTVADAPTVATKIKQGTVNIATRKPGIDDIINSSGGNEL